VIIFFNDFYRNVGDF